MSLLSAEMVRESLGSLPEWKLEGKEIVRRYEFADFAAAMVFVNRVAEKAEAAGHHPDIDIRYNKVRVALVSHDKGGVTGRDVSMAKTIDLISWGRYQGASSVCGVCWRILARVLRSQMATAIPPSAAEVANRRPVRQRFRGSGTGCESSTSTGPDLKLANFRMGTDFLVGCET